MADKGYIAAQINALPEASRVPLKNAFDYLIDEWKIGTGSKAINARWYRFSSTTHATANTEFSVVHGLGSVPTQLFPVLDLSQVNSQIVPLTVSRAPDANRIYLKSSSTSAVFVALLEV